MTSTETTPELQFPWPEHIDDGVTRDYLAASYAEAAVRAWSAAWDLGSTSPEWLPMVETIVKGYVSAHLLRALPADIADAVARDLVGNLDDGGVTSELVWEWLSEYGGDPEKAREAGRQIAATINARRPTA
jgi:hypothetical protein